MQNISDAELVKRAQNRKQDPAAGAEAVGELYDRYHEAIFRYIWSRVSNQQLAEDLAGEVFTRMVTNLPNYRHTGAPFQAWLFRIAHNLVIDSHRESSTHQEVPLEQGLYNSEGQDDPAQIFEEQAFIEQIRVLLKELKPFKQDVLILRFIIGLSLEEVATILGRNKGVIKVTQHRALKELRQIIASTTDEE